MSDANKEKKWLTAWQQAASVLQDERTGMIRRGDARELLRITTGLLQAYYKKNPMPTNSGLVEQQKLFRKLE
ncbi:hypothetical protein GF407_04805 [candidate division KSB1 bacterium]|nr:hypothetical protein [candidate division KSB1 bacterium]